MKKKIDGEVVNAEAKGNMVHFTHIASGGKAVWNKKDQEWTDKTTCNGLFLVKLRKQFKQLF